jgi:nickel-dependent lactate racemase
VIVQLPGDPAQRFTVEIPDDKYVGGASHAQSMLHGESLAEALAAPLGYPPLSQAVIPGDRVTVAVDPLLPQATRLVRELIDLLTGAGCGPADITVLIESEQESRFRAALSDAAMREVQVIGHDAADASSHAYLAATREGNPVYLHRAIGDADVMIPLAATRRQQSCDVAASVHSAWYPVFSNAETQQRLATDAQRRKHKAPSNEAEEAAWLLGLRFVVQAVPGIGGSVASIVSGDAELVQQATEQDYHRLWNVAFERTADLVIATVDSEPSKQSWEQIADALSAAANVARDGCPIVLWTDLSTPPRPAMATWNVEANSGWSSKADATTRRIAEAVESYRVYLRSRLADASLEDTGLAPLQEIEQLQRLVNRAQACAVIRSAQFACTRLLRTVET